MPVVSNSLILLKSTLKGRSCRESRLKKLIQNSSKWNINEKST